MSKAPVLTFHGAARTVTGSAYEIAHDGQRLLIDCGMFQGSRSLERLNIQPFDFDATAIDAVILTHAHIDHSGLLPKLVRAGFTGTIWCTEPTRDLLEYMLPDSGRIQEAEAERHNRRPDRRDERPFEPLYGEADAIRTMEQIETQPYDEWFEPLPGFRARLWNAGHILGSSSVELSVGDVRLLFSGDIGPEEKAFHPDPDAPAGLDHVLCESTYGDRDKHRPSITERRHDLEREIEDALARGGNLVIPAFAIERTQELLLDIARLINEGHLAHRPVFIDSPLATRATSVFRRHAQDLEDLGHGNIFSHPSFHFVETVDQSRRLNEMSGAIIIAASGMAEAGRVRHHLLHNLPRKDSTVLFVGFAAQGTLARVLMDGAERVRMSGRDVTVRANIRTIDHYSAHADRSELLAWIAARQPVNGTLFLTHGEAQSSDNLKATLEAERPDASIIVPEIGEAWALLPGRPAKRLKTGRQDICDAVGCDWQNDYAALASHLKQDLQHISDSKLRREAIARMRAILDDYGGRLPRRNERSPR